MFVIACNASGLRRPVEPPAPRSASEGDRESAATRRAARPSRSGRRVRLRLVKRLVSILALLALAALAALVVTRLRSSRAGQSALGGDQPLSGSFDTWPEVPLKQSA